MAPTMMGTPVSAETAEMPAASSPLMAKGFSHSTAFLPARQAGDDLGGVELVRAADGHDVHAGIGEEFLHAGAEVCAHPAGHGFRHGGIHVHDVADFQNVARAVPGRAGGLPG